MEMYKQLLELFNSCQNASIILANTLMESQGICKKTFLQYLKFDTLKLKDCDEREVCWNWLWVEFINACSLGQITVYGESSIEGIRHLTGLRIFRWLYYTPIFTKHAKDSPARHAAPDLSPLAGHTNLLKFELGYIVDTELRFDTYRFCDENQLDLSPLASCTKLIEFSTYSANIRNIEPLAKLKNLEIISIRHSYRIASYEPLRELPNLHDLTLSAHENIDYWDWEYRAKRVKKAMRDEYMNIALTRSQRFADYAGKLVKKPSNYFPYIVMPIARLDAFCAKIALQHYPQYSQAHPYYPTEVQNLINGNI